MKHYIDAAGNLFAYEADGSQDSLISEDQVLATPEQIKAAQTPKFSKNDQIHAEILALETTSLTPRGARELHLRLMANDMAHPYYVKLKQLDEQIATLRKGLTA